MSGRIKDRRPKIKHWLQNKNDRNQVRQIRKKKKNCDITAKKPLQKNKNKKKERNDHKMSILVRFCNEFFIQSGEGRKRNVFLNVLSAYVILEL